MLEHIRDQLFPPTGNTLWAVTINPSPNKLINKKRWRFYDNDQQERTLLRIVNLLVAKHPSIKCVEKHFETCPSNGQIHLHGLFEFTEEWLTTLENWINHSIAWTDDKSNPPWRHLQVDPIFNKEGWLEYIRKYSYLSN